MSPGSACVLSACECNLTRSVGSAPQALKGCTARAFSVPLFGGEPAVFHEVFERDQVRSDPLPCLSAEEFRDGVSDATRARLVQQFDCDVSSLAFRSRVEPNGA